MHIVTVINKHAGSIKTLADLDDYVSHIHNELGKSGYSVDIKLVKSNQLQQALEHAAQDAETDILIACGGDGTASLAASLAFKYSKIFGLIPAGTMNLFARSLGMPLEPYAAITAISKAEIVDCDLASVNGRTYVHQFSIGMQAQLIEKREEGNYNSQMTKMLAGLGATISVLSDDQTYTFAMAMDDKPKDYEVSLLTVSNNPYGKGHLPYADDLNSHQLGVYWAQAMTAVQKSELVFNILSGNWNRNSELHNSTCSSLCITFDEPVSGLNASLDGELIALEKELLIKNLPDALKILRPKQDISQNK